MKAEADLGEASKPSDSSGAKEDEKTRDFRGGMHGALASGCGVINRDAMESPRASPTNDSTSAADASSLHCNLAGWCSFCYLIQNGVTAPIDSAVNMTKSYDLDTTP